MRYTSLFVERIEKKIIMINVEIENEELSRNRDCLLQPQRAHVRDK